MMRRCVKKPSGGKADAQDMSNILIIYTSIEGQTERIAERMAQTLAQLGHEVKTLHAEHQRIDPQLSRFDGVIVGASIHYGNHPAHLLALVRRCRADLTTRPSAFFSVSLSGGGPGARPKTAQRYLDKFQRRTGWQPPQLASIGGALQYSKYAAWKKWIMTKIVGFAGGDTDTSRDYEYTDWDAVAEFARSFARRLS